MEGPNWLVARTMRHMEHSNYEGRLLALLRGQEVTVDKARAWQLGVEDLGSQALLAEFLSIEKLLATGDCTKNCEQWNTDTPSIAPLQDDHAHSQPPETACAGKPYTARRHRHPMVGEEKWAVQEQQPSTNPTPAPLQWLQDGCGN